MKKISIQTAKPYDVLVGSGILKNAANHIKQVLSPCKIALISDSHVFPLYGEELIRQLESEGFSILHFVFSAGEEQKNGETYWNILNFLAENQFTRSDALIALGGGVVGDMTGFAAATFLRGIAFVQIPTTLLAMVDSSVGGKTAIDLPAGKNLVGAFYQPKLVLCDPDTLNTLPKQILSDGSAEVIKYGILYDSALFEHMETHGLSFDRDYIICRCVELKNAVVSEDEFDRGSRQKLNLGHTLGHSIEVNSHYTISHGQAVAIGMALICKSAESLGYCEKGVYDRLCNILKNMDLPYKTDLTAEVIFEKVQSDKKRSGDIYSMIIPRSIGDCIISPTTAENLKIMIKAGL